MINNGPARVWAAGALMVPRVVRALSFFLFVHKRTKMTSHFQHDDERRTVRHLHS